LIEITVILPHIKLNKRHFVLMNVELLSLPRLSNSQLLLINFIILIEVFQVILLSFSAVVVALSFYVSSNSSLV
jgi:hypothetical protein